MSQWLENFRFAYPLVLLALAVLPLLWWLWRSPRRRPVLRYSSLESLRLAVSPWRRRARGVLPVLRTLALLCLVVAAARPQTADESSRIFAEGIAIEMVVDTSGSMRDTDLSTGRTPETRLDVVKDVFRKFVAGVGDLPGRPNDLIGIIRFARYADSICPLTLDHANVLEVLKTVEIVRRQDEDGTAIGDALGLAVARLASLKRTAGSGEQMKIKSRIVILLTDGENNAGTITPRTAGELAAAEGVKVYSILAGTGQRLGFARVPVDDRDLRYIAEKSGGRFFQATDGAALEKIYGEIDQLERTRVEERRFVRWQEIGAPLWLGALGLLALQTLLDATLLRKIP